MLERRSPAGLVCATCLLALAAFEYWPLPSRAHDALPTASHRWLTSQPETARIFDCAKGDPSLFTVPWLMQRSVTFASDVAACADPKIGDRLSALGYTHLIAREGTDVVRPAATAANLTPAVRFTDSQVYTVGRTPPPIVTVGAEGFFAFEHDGDDWWRWMGPEGFLTIRNTTSQTRTTFLVLRLLPAREPRTLNLVLDGQPIGQVDLGIEGREVSAGPWTLTPGDHSLKLDASGAPFRPADAGGSADTRRLSVMFRAERWVDTSGSPP